MDKIELMENILSQYRNIQKVIKETEQDKKRGELLLNKEEERYDEAKAEFGEHLLDEYQTKVLEEYEKNVNDYKEKLGKIDETAKKLNEKKKLMYSDENIRNVTQGLMEIDKKIKQKELELRKSNLALDEYYMKDDKEGKLPQDFYNEQDKIKKEISDLTSKKDKFEKFLDELKIGRDNLMKPFNIEKIPLERKEPGQGQPGQGQPEQGQPGQGQPGQGQPEQGQPGQGQPGQGQPGQGQPGQGHPGQGQPGQGQPGQGQGGPNKLTYKVLIGKTARIRFDGDQYYIPKEVVKEGANLTDLQLKNILQKTGFELDTIKDLTPLIKEGLIDSTVVNVIFNAKLENAKKEDIMKRYIKDCYETATNNKKAEGKIYYDRQDLSKTSIIQSILRKEITQDEKLKILGKAEKAARYGIGRLEGDYKPDIRSRIVNFFTRQKTQKQLTVGQLQNVAEAYNELRDSGETEKISQKDFRDEIKLNKKELDELGKLKKSQEAQEKSSNRQGPQDPTR